VTDETRTPYDVAVLADGPGCTSVRVDLTPYEAALLAHVGERIAGASHDALRLDVEVPRSRPTRGYWVNGPRVHLEESVTRPRPQAVPTDLFPGEPQL
jgi:hypothetical protein